MRLCYRRGGKGTAPEGFDRVYTEIDGSGHVLRELLAYVRAGDSVTVEMGGELGGAAGAFTEMALALYQRQATLLCKSPKIDTAAGHWQAVFSDLATLTGRNTDDAARLSRFMEELHRCFDLVERRQMLHPSYNYFTINFSIFLLNFERRIASETLASSRKFKVQIQGTPLDFRGY